MENNNFENIVAIGFKPYSGEDYDKHDLEWQKTKRFAEDTNHRKWLIFWVKCVVSLWLLCVIIVVAFNSIFQFNLNDSVLIALLTTTTVNILGLAFIVLTGLFKNKE